MIFSPTHIINQFPNWLAGDHWSRHLLGGSGIICGFEWQMNDDCTLQLCGGYGLTSDGTILCTPEAQYHFTHYQAFDAPTDYPLFNNGDNLPVWELLTTRPLHSANEVFPLTPQNEAAALNLFLQDKVLLVFLDKREEESDDPSGPSTPDGPIVYAQGPTSPAAPTTTEQAYQLRFLVMQQTDIIGQLGLTERVAQIIAQRHSDADYIYSEDYSNDDEVIYENDIYQAADLRLDWPEISLYRFGFGCLDAFDCEPGDLENVDYPPAGAAASLDEVYTRYVCIINKATKQLDLAIRKLQTWLIEHCYCFEQDAWTEWLEMLCAKWEAYKALNQVQDSSLHKKEYVQYFYDWCRGLIQAYHELRYAVLCWSASCQPDATAHPCHLIIGLATRQPATAFPPALRHTFQTPPSFHDAAKLKEEIRLAHYRLLLMINSFYLPYAIPDDAINPFCVHEREGNEDELPDMSVIKVTPGRYYDQPIGSQSIPFYYPLTEGNLSLHNYWDAFRTRTNQVGLHRSYHASVAEESYAQLPQVTHPFRFNIDRDDFFHIEGHINYADFTPVDIKNNIIRLIRKWNLPFDVQIIALTDLFAGGNGLTKYIGAEHLGGVRSGGTFILVTGTINEGSNETVIADFSLPYRCCADVEEEGTGAIIIPGTATDSLDINDYTYQPTRDLGSFTTVATAVGVADAAVIEQAYTNQMVGQTTAAVAAINQATLASTQREEVGRTLTALVNAPNEIKAAEAHRVYKKAAAVLVEASSDATPTERQQLAEATNALTKLYITRMAIIKPNELTTGAKNALKAVKNEELGVDTKVIATQWREEMSGKVSPALDEKLVNLDFD